MADSSSGPGRLHGLLQRQLRRCEGTADLPPATWKGFVAAVHQAYVQADEDRVLLERSMDLASRELGQRNDDLKRDITARVEAERALVANQARMQALVDGLPDVILRISQDGKVLDWHGRRPEGYEGNAVPGLPEGQQDSLLDHIARALESRAVQVWEYEAPSPSAAARHFEARLAASADDEVIAIVRDVTETRRMQDQLLLNDRLISMGSMAASVAHEINNPLACVIGNLDHVLFTLADSPVADGDLEEALREARMAADRVRKIVADMRASSRRQDAKVGPVSLAGVLDSAIRLSASEVRHRARVIRDYVGAPEVLGDDGRLTQVFVNLLVNAAQAIPEGRVDRNEIAVSVTRDGQKVVVSVRDSGCGIPVDVAGRIFEPFFTTKPVGAGTGLGLSIVHSIVTALGGEVSVESVVGEGTTFRVSLTAAEVSDAVPARVPAEESRPRQCGRVLIVDDEIWLTRMIKRVLADHDLVEAHNGREAIELILGTDGIDLILCDLMMPDMTGMEVYDHIRAERPGLEQRIVFMTGGVFTARARTFFERVPNHRFEKPFDVAALRALVCDYVTSGHERRSLAAA